MSTPAPTAAAAPAPLRPHYPCLEGIRTLGVMALFFQHTGYSTGLQLRQFEIAGQSVQLFAWMGHLEWGPGMFFVLSAFLLYQPFSIAAFTDRPPPRWGKFLKARLLRVVPAYWLTMILLILFFRADPNDPGSAGVKVDSWADVIQVFTFTQVYFPENFAAGITAAYTLCAEVVFYLVVPLFGAWLVKRSRGLSLDARLRLQLVSLAVLSLGAFVYRQVVYGPVPAGTFCTDNPDSYRCAAVRWFPGYLDYFCLGAAIAAIVVWSMLRDRETPWLEAVGRHPQALWAVMLVVFAFYSTQFGTQGLETVGIRDYQIRYYLVGTICLLMLLPGAIGDPSKGIVRHFLRWRPIAYTGMVSYGVYLWHQGWTDKAIEWTEGAPFYSRPLDANFLLITGIAVVLSIITATVSWYWWEQPINRRRDVALRDWFKRRPA